MSINKIIIPLLLACSSVTQADTLPCQEKIDDIKQKIQFAEGIDNPEKLAALQHALNRVVSHCSDAKQLAIAAKEVKKEQQDFDQQLQDLLAEQQKLSDALKVGDVDEINEQKQDVADKHQDVKEAQHELDEALAAHQRLTEIQLK